MYKNKTLGRRDVKKQNSRAATKYSYILIDFTVFFINIMGQKS